MRKNSFPLVICLLMLGLVLSRCGKNPDPIPVVNPPAPVQIGNPNPGQCSWAPQEGLSNPNVAQPMASPKKTTVYTQTCSSLCGVAKSSMTFRVWKEQPDGSVKEVVD